MWTRFFCRYPNSGLRLLFLQAILLSFLCAACQSTSVPPPVEWNFQPKSIHVDYEAAPDLNQYAGSSHTLMFMIFQLSDATDFIEYTRTEDGIQRLLQLHDIDPRQTIGIEDMVGVQTVFINPGSRKTLAIDRLGDARWVGFVAGYFDFVPGQCTGIVSIPVEKTEEGLFLKKISAMPGDLRVGIQFGPRAMRIQKVQK